ncbi:MAG TPA: dihydrodipicolinate synthase family protein [Alphaproteobacteria bacterium]|nr:dihydrodipicolinate synthase family protein [Alphaproteobacteria bacterium]
MTNPLTESAKGVFIIAATPFTDAGAIDWPSVDTMVEFYLGHGVDGMTILGMMGEAQKLLESESLEFTRTVLRRVAGRVPVVVGVSSPGTAGLVKLSTVAMEAGAAGVMIAPIPGIKTETQLRAYFDDVIAALGPSVPVVYQDYPQSTGVNISADCFVSMVDAHQSLVMFKHEDWPGLRKLARIRKACNGTLHRRVSILAGNGGLYLPQELRRGADGAMTGFAFPEMLVGVCRLHAAGKSAEAEDLFDTYLPLVCYEQQPGIGLAIRKEILRRRGAFRSAALRAPGPKLDADDMREIDALLARLAERLDRVGRQAAA